MTTLCPPFSSYVALIFAPFVNASGATLMEAGIARVMPSSSVTVFFVRSTLWIVPWISFTSGFIDWAGGFSIVGG